jgi:hypothetical protein
MMSKTIWSMKTPNKLGSRLIFKETGLIKDEKNSRGVSNTIKESTTQTAWVKLKATK